MKLDITVLIASILTGIIVAWIVIYYESREVTWEETLAPKPEYCHSLFRAKTTEAMVIFDKVGCDFEEIDAEDKRVRSGKY